MKVGVIIPTRGDSPRFLENCIKQMEGQTLLPEVIYTVDFDPTSAAKDITKRYRVGYDKLCGEGVDVIAFIEDDEAYSPDFLRAMALAWSDAGKPELFGTTYTHYYHLIKKSYFTMYHLDRSSMMNTFIKPNLTFNWCADENPYTDIHLWNMAKKGDFTWALHNPNPPLSLGIKHGVGLCGGEFHTTVLEEFSGPRATKDPNGDLLRQVCSPESFEFFNTYFSESPEKQHLL